MWVYEPKQPLATKQPWAWGTVWSKVLQPQQATDNEGTLSWLMTPCLRPVFFVSTFPSRGGLFCHELYGQRPTYIWLLKKKAWAWIDNKRSIICKEHYLFHSKMAPEAGAGRVISATIFLSRLRLTLTSEQTRFAILQFLFMPGAPKDELKLAYNCVFTTPPPHPTRSRAQEKSCAIRKPAEGSQNRWLFWQNFQREKSKKINQREFFSASVPKGRSKKKLSARELCHFFGS